MIDRCTVDIKIAWCASLCFIHMSLAQVYGVPPNQSFLAMQFPPVCGSVESRYTLQGTNISPKNGILKMIFLFPRWDILISWRVICIADNFRPFIVRRWETSVLLFIIIHTDTIHFDLLDAESTRERAYGRQNPLPKKWSSTKDLNENIHDIFISPY